MVNVELASPVCQGTATSEVYYALGTTMGRGRSLFFSPYRLQRATSPVSATNDEPAATVPAAAMMLIAGFYAALPALTRRRGHDPDLPPPALRKATRTL
jgi:hypothetical protein